MPDLIQCIETGITMIGINHEARDPCCLSHCLRSPEQRESILHPVRMVYNR
jgi:hypothetical protein